MKSLEYMRERRDIRRLRIRLAVVALEIFVAGGMLRIIIEIIKP